MNCLPRMNVLSPFVPVWKAGLHIREDLKASMRCDWSLQPGPYFGRNCWLSWLPRSQKASYTSHDPHRYGDFRLFPTEMTVFLAACCCPAILALAVRLYGFVGSIDAFTGSLSRGLARHPWKYPLQKVSRKSMQPQVLGIYIVTLFLVFPQSRTSFHAIRPLFLCCTQHPNWNGTHIGIG